VTPLSLAVAVGVVVVVVVVMFELLYLAEICPLVVDSKVNDIGHWVRLRCFTTIAVAQQLLR